MMDEPENKDPLTAFFDAGRAARPEPGDALMARIMADADRVQAERAEAPAPGPRRGLFAGLAQALGGWPAMAGLATATVAGLWIGVSPPSGLAGVAQDVMAGANEAYLIDLDPDATFVIADGGF
ncbi:hypothetical protein [Roseovarius indicus]|uniref:hypothetical protein n=1 Tax=Roseovarius indicus TaxID=540747 RepID=UPI0032EFA53A